MKKPMLIVSAFLVFAGDAVAQSKDHSATIEELMLAWVFCLYIIGRRIGPITGTA
jgi:hypothetical protein